MLDKPSMANPSKNRRSASLADKFAANLKSERLRRKLSQAVPERELIRSVYGVGFAYEP